MSRCADCGSWHPSVSLCDDGAHRCYRCASEPEEPERDDHEDQPDDLGPLACEECGSSPRFGGWLPGALDERGRCPWCSLAAGRRAR